MTNVTTTLQASLRDRYPPPEWVLAFEVQAERDEGGLRFADAIAMDLRKKAGNAVHGFELKVSRSDWLKEFADPEKSRTMRDLVDFWWVVAGAADIVRSDELPKGVGLMAATGEGFLKVEQFPIHRNPRSDNEGIDRALMAAILRRLDPMEARTYWMMRERRAEQRGYVKGRNAVVRDYRSRNRQPIHRAREDEELNLP